MADRVQRQLLVECTAQHPHRRAGSGLDQHARQRRVVAVVVLTAPPQRRSGAKVDVDARQRQQQPDGVHLVVRRCAGEGGAALCILRVRVAGVRLHIRLQDTALHDAKATQTQGVSMLVRDNTWR